MRRFLVSLLLVLLAAISVVNAADESIRQVQTRLKQDGFYFGEVNGNYDSATAAAVSRYQIRNGLPITGKLDAETTKALGVASAPQTAQQPGEETWRRLRTADEQFLRRVKPATNSGDYSSVLVLSPERLRDYVGAFVLAGLDAEVDSELGFFADQVRYYNDGVVGREKIRRDLQRYNERWPERRFWLAGEVKVDPQPDSRLRITFPLRYELQNKNRQSSGKVVKTLTVEVVGEDLQIVEVNERKPLLSTTR